MIEALEAVKSSWEGLCRLYDWDFGIQLQGWQQLCRYSEPHRHYHTFDHIYDLLQLSQRYSSEIHDMTTITLAILFHDIVYDPKSPSNEEDSIVIFQSLLSPPRLPVDVFEKVTRYILCTKSHKLSPEDEIDEDLKLFLDLDMSILSSARERYLRYTNAIRQEYIHIPLAEYRLGRGNFLRNIVTSEDVPLYHSKYFSQWENTARENINSEIDLLAGIDSFSLI